MSNDFSGAGNLGTAPQLTKVNDPSGKNEPRSVCNMRVYFDRRVADKQEASGFKDKGGFWLSVDIWGFRADEAMRLLKTGSRIFVEGSLREETWTDEKTGEIRKEMKLSADMFFIDSLCIESLMFKKNKRANGDGDDAGESS